MLVQNPFLECQTKKSDFQWLRVNTNKLKNYSLKCDQVLFGCDEIKAISQGDGLKNAPCFQVPNDTNSKEKFVIEKGYFSQDIFDGITIIRNNFDSFDMYSVIVNYDGLAPFSLIDFKFYSPNSRAVNSNSYYSDITIHGKAFRISCIENFDILKFIQELIQYNVKYKDGIKSHMYYDYLCEYYITRYDYRFDFFHKNKYGGLKFHDVFSPNTRIKKNSDNTLVKDRKIGKIYSGWTAGNRKNHYVYTRMYQKQLEILDNGLDDLYHDYINYDGKVWRLEFEFGSDFTKKARGKHFLVDEFLNHGLENMAYEYVGIKAPKGGFSCSKSEKPKFKDRSVLARARALSMFWSIGKSIFDSGLDPHFYLDAGLLKKGLSIDEINSLRKPYTLEELQLLNFNFEDYKKHRKEMYENIYKNQLGVEI